MSGNSVEQDEVLGAIRYQLRTLSESVSHEDQRKRHQWQEDAEVLKAYVSALSATRQVLKEEQNRVLAKIEPAKRRKGRKRTGGDAMSGQSSFLSKNEVQERLEEFRRRVKEAEVRVEQAMDNLSVAVRTEERSMLEDQIAIMGETRKLCLEEAKLLEVMLKEMEVAEQKRKEQEADWKELGHLKDQLTKLEAKIDQAKRCLLFPSVHGYRFRAGTGGIYIGAKDLYLSDLSASFSLSVESVRQSEQSAVIRINMGGREPRPPTLSISEDTSYGESMDVVSAAHANEINNNNSHSFPAAPIDPNVVTEENVEGQSMSNGRGDSDDGSARLVADEVGDMAAPHQIDPLAPDSASASHSTATSVEDRDDASEQLTGVSGQEQTETPESNPSLSEAPDGDVSSLHELKSVEAETVSEHGEGVEVEKEEEDHVVHTLQRATPGKNLAMKFLTRIADKSHLPRGVARASQALFFTAPPQAKPSSSPSPATHNHALLKRFVLANDATASSRTSQHPPLRTPLQYKPKSQAAVIPATSLKHMTPAAELPSEANIDHSAATIAQPKLTEKGTPLSLHDVSKSVAEDISIPNHAVHRRTGSNGSTMDRSHLPPRKAPSFFETASECLSDTTSVVGTGHKGVHVKLQGTHVSVIAEKGTRVPNMTVRDITLEIECSLSVVFEYSLQHGWQSPDGLKFEIMQLRKKTIGNSIPMPAGLIKTLLNLILPRIVERALLSALPRELGTYVLESEKGMAAAGEIVAAGPPLSTLEAQLNTTSPYERSRSYASDLKAYSAVQEAQSLLSLTSEEAMLLGECFSTSTAGLLEASDGWTGVCSIKELCRFYDKYSSTEVWLALCDLWNKAVGYIAKAKGMESTLDFKALMNGAVARLAAKPVRTQCHFTRLSCELNVDACLLALRDYCERSAREMHEEKPLSVSVPLDQQLKALHEWYSTIKTRLVHFKAHFKSFMAAIVARADAKNLQIGLEEASYEGPLHFQIPVIRESQEPGMLSYDVAIPPPGSSSSTQFIDSLSRALYAIHAFKKQNDQNQLITDQGREEERQLEWGVSSFTQEMLEKVLQQSSDSTEQEEEALHESLSLGRAFLKSLRTSVALNADYLSQQLFNGSGMSSITQLKSYLENLGDVIVGDLSPISDRQNGNNNNYHLTFQTNHFARFKCLADTAGFQSTVSPAEVFSMLHICAREYLTTFCKDDLNRLRATDRLFKHIIRYVDKRSLDVVFCSKLQSSIIDSKLKLSLTELDGGSENGIRYPIHFTNDLDVSLLMDSLTFAQGKLEA